MRIQYLELDLKYLRDVEDIFAYLPLKFYQKIFSLKDPNNSIAESNRKGQKQSTSLFFQFDFEYSNSDTWVVFGSQRVDYCSFINCKMYSNK
jgi:hypothetical protein